MLAMTPATDVLGVRLYNDEIRDIWNEQKRYINCIQDPPGVHSSDHVYT